jgi:uncharacterized protein
MECDGYAADAVRLGISETLLKLLVCPVDKGELAVADSALVCSRCGRSYPVEEGIPSMLAVDNNSL